MRRTCFPRKTRQAPRSFFSLVMDDPGSGADPSGNRPDHRDAAYAVVLLSAYRRFGMLAVFVEFGNDYGWLRGAVGNPIAPCLHPSPPAPRKARIVDRRGK
jgi:hypothetical protein